MTRLLEDLQAYAAVAAPSGREQRLAELVRERWEAFGPVHADRLGTLSVTIGEGTPHLALAAHLDEVGFVIRRIDGDGFVHLNRLGGVPERVLTMRSVLLLGRDGPVEGIIGTWPHHYTPDDAKYRVPPIGETYVDIGARSAADVAERFGLRVGDYGVYTRTFRQVDDRIHANALDDRAGLAALTELARRLTEHPPGRAVSLIASVQEEYSARALVPTVRRLAPDVLVAVDVSPATDTPETRHYSDVAVGAGPVVHLHSFHGRGTLAGVLPPAWLVDEVEAAAGAAGIGLQRASFFGGLTDGSFAQLEHDGIPTIEIGVPVRYTHSPVEVGSAQDLEGLVATLTQLCQRGGAA